MSPEKKRKRLLLVDGSSYLFRAYHALPALTNSEGLPTGAVYGVTSMLRKLLAETDPAYVAVVFDAAGPSFRNELYPAYKANRPPMPEDLRCQIEAVHEIVRAMGLPVLVEEGVEADDVIGTLAERARREGLEVLISTGDKDMAQLVDEQVTLVDTMKDSVLDREGVIRKFGVPPERIVDYLALVGDASDNVPGVPKVGPKTAARWLAEYGSLDGVVGNAGAIKGKVGENLRGFLDRLPLSKELVTIRRDLPLEVGPLDLAPAPADTDRLREIYGRLEFKGWLAELEAGADGAAEAPGLRTETVLDLERLDRWLGRAREKGVLAVDTETTSLSVVEAELVGVSLAVEPGEAAYVPCGHRYAGAPAQIGREALLERLRPLLEDPGIVKIGHNLKYDMAVLARYGVELKGPVEDSMLESYVLDSTAARHDMDSLALKYLGHRTVTYDEVTGTGRKRIGFEEVPLEEAAPYAAEDAEVTLRLHGVLRPRLREAESLDRLYREIELPLVPVLSRMERHGVRIDAAMLEAQSRELAGRMDEIEARAHEEAGEAFNLSSPKQIREILFDRLGLPVVRKTPKGQPSTSEEVLEELALRFDLPRLILEHRGLSKLKSTYTDKLPRMISPATGRVHTSYHQAVAATGRLSSSDPNLQNIPVRTAEGRRIREAFVAEPGMKILSADYSQIELRIMAHFSGDRGLLSAFREGRDIHRATAAEIFGISELEVTPRQRRPAKVINFGLIYGMSAFGLARQLGVDRATAQEYIDRYFARYPGVRSFMDGIRERARKQGYVETLFGRRLHLPEIRSRNAARRQYAERTAVNAPMQGTAADLIKIAMVRIDRWIREEGRGVRMIMQVHDELVFEVPEERLEETARVVRGAMTGAGRLDVPLVVDIGAGDNWDEAH